MYRISPRWGPRAERRHGHTCPSLTQKLVPVDNTYKWKVVFSERVSLGKQTSFKGRICAWQKMASTKGTLGCFGSSSIQSVVPGHFVFNSWKPFVYILCLSALYFYGIPVCVKTCVSVLLSVSCAFSLVSSVHFVLFHFTSCCFISSYSTLVYSLDTCCFLTEGRKGGDLDGRGVRECKELEEGKL